jgi:hypothetical protein
MQRARLLLIAVCMVVVLGISLASFGQAISLKVTPRPGYAKMPNVNINKVSPPSRSIRFVLPAGKTSTKGLFLNDSNSNGGGSDNRAANKHNNNGGVANLVGLNTVPTFTGAFASPAPTVDPDQTPDGVIYDSTFIMIGNNPQLGGTTVIPANITTVSVQLLNANGGVLTTVPFAPFEDLTEDSPNFRDSNYSVGRTQYGDAVQRAEFFSVMAPDWHTKLAPQIVNRAVIQVPPTVQIQFADGTVITVPGYTTTTAPDGSTVVFVLDLLFGNLDFNQAVNDIDGGMFTTNAINYHVYPNTYLFSVIDEQGDTVCCTLGFHEYIYDPTQFPSPRWIYAFASWISPGLFGRGFQDVTSLSHETSESLNDPFVNNIVPTWQYPGMPGVCQANLETGDPVAVLPAATVPIVTREGNEVFTYHPQTEALLEWFEIGNPSNAIGGAFSYPNTSALTSTATPCPF